MLVPKHLLKSGLDANPERGAGSYAQAYQQRKLDEIQADLDKKRIEKQLKD
tara:strand:+ start:390 stop:542 length:153 start_codon:yes stop_codon:yes gene_type:complete